MMRSSREEFHERHRSRGGLLSSLNRLIGFLIIAAILIACAFAFIPLLKKNKEQAAYIETLKQQIAHEQEIVTLHAQQAELLKSDPEYIETIARDKLDLMKPGETIYRIEKPAQSATAAPVESR